MSSTLVRILLVGALAHVDAGVSGSVTVTKDGSAISPTLKPSSDKKFFGKDKDYQSDKRPKVDVLHFKHPYPAVQDSGDFDQDYVKDENSDNGSWKAQTEYDRLRHKLAKEKAEVEKALAAKKKAEQDLQDATQREKDQEERKKKKLEEEEEAKEKKREEEEAKKRSEEEDRLSGRNYVVAESNETGNETTAAKMEVDSSEVQKAMDALENCKKQLEEARKKLKELMKELDEARNAQDKSQDALDSAQDRLRKLQEGQAAADKSVEKEHQEYLEARAAYEKQQAKVEKMEQDIAAAAAKVKAFRDAADRDGGVYPTEKKSGAATQSLAIVALSALSFLLQ